MHAIQCYVFWNNRILSEIVIQGLVIGGIVPLLTPSTIIGGNKIYPISTFM